MTLSYGDYLASSATIQYNRKAESQLLINPLGLVQIDSTTVRVLEQELLAYDKLKDTELIIFSKD